MIIKIAYEGWQYFENAKDLHVRYYQEGDPLVWDELMLITHDVIENISSEELPRYIGFKLKNKDNEKRGFQDIVRLQFGKGESMYTVMTDCTIYLMNDEGKTIERIN